MWVMPASAKALGRAAFLYSVTLSRAGTLDGVVLISNSFLAQCTAEADLIRAVPLLNLAGSRTWSFHRASLCVRLTGCIF